MVSRYYKKGERPANDFSIPIAKRLKNIEKIGANAIIKDLIAEGELPYKTLPLIMRVINKFHARVIEEVIAGKKVSIIRFGYLYPQDLPERVYRNPRTGEEGLVIKKNMAIRFKQQDKIRYNIRANYKGIKRVETKK